jgi:hypothetical protein
VRGQQRQSVWAARLESHLGRTTVRGPFPVRHCVWFTINITIVFVCGIYSDIYISIPANILKYLLLLCEAIGLNLHLVFIPFFLTYIYFAIVLFRKLWGVFFSFSFSSSSSAFSHNILLLICLLILICFLLRFTS